jgi:hypothetical protein
VSVTLCRGRIIWAEYPDPDGKNEKLRPAAILDQDSDIDGKSPICCVALSHSAAKRRPLAATHIPVPWNKSGAVRTKLKKATVAVCEWVPLVDPAKIDDIAGVLPPITLADIFITCHKHFGGDIPGLKSQPDIPEE